MSFRPHPDVDRARRQLFRHRTGTPNTPRPKPMTYVEAFDAAVTANAALLRMAQNSAEILARTIASRR